MDKKTGFLRRNLSFLVFVAIYLLFVIILLFLESFQWETQWNVLTVFVPFFLIGVILDYIISRDRELNTGYQIFTQLLPAGIFVLYGISEIQKLANRPQNESFTYLIWLFIAVPFFITSNLKNNYRRRLISSIIGTALVGAVYIQLSTKTDTLNTETGLYVYLICIFLVFYAASQLKKIFYINVIMGFIDGAVLIFLWKNPITEASKYYGWDYDIALNFELLLLVNFILSILICLVSTFIKDKKANRK
jgi:peptidoglycan/LPS O-acetylase OafA/YrhL